MRAGCPNGGARFVPPVHGWHLFTSQTLGWAVWLPPTWSGFDLLEDSDAVVNTCSNADARIRATRRQLLIELKASGAALLRL